VDRNEQVALVRLGAGELLEVAWHRRYGEGLGQRLPQPGQGVVDSPSAAGWNDQRVADLIAVDRGGIWVTQHVRGGLLDKPRDVRVDILVAAPQLLGSRDARSLAQERDAAVGGFQARQVPG
jgi:hypothetical protein